MNSALFLSELHIEAGRGGVSTGQHMFPQLDTGCLIFCSPTHPIQASYCVLWPAFRCLLFALCCSSLKVKTRVTRRLAYIYIYTRKLRISDQTSESVTKNQRPRISDHIIRISDHISQISDHIGESATMNQRPRLNDYMLTLKFGRCFFF